jgi:DNA-binding IclR family transcriptional regulator
VTDAARLRRLLADVRRTGVVIAPGSVEAVSTGVAVPIRDAGTVVAALSVVLPRETPPEPAIAALRDAAAAVEAALRADRR